jgi:hypothetical protein
VVEHHPAQAVFQFEDFAVMEHVHHALALYRFEVMGMVTSALMVTP